MYSTSFLQCAIYSPNSQLFITRVLVILYVNNATLALPGCSTEEVKDSLFVYFISI